MRIITFRVLGTEDTITATVEGRTKAEADGNAIRILAEADRSTAYEIGRPARAGEARSLPTLTEALTRLV